MGIITRHYKKKVIKFQEVVHEIINNRKDINDINSICLISDGTGNWRKFYYQ